MSKTFDDAASLPRQQIWDGVVSRSVHGENVTFALIELAANGVVPAIVLTSSRDRSDFAYEIVASPAHGFIPKSELSAEAITSLIR